ncbi:hypothetical protein P0L94_00775 [Microbacter sp. GSS18]|nr:hypothetical protein P0L94_00775 [Microbacter sp. GSS18]
MDTEHTPKYTGPRPEDWGDVPEAERTIWMRYFIDYPPAFPGAFAMNMMARAALAGRTDVSPRWSRFGAAMHANGFGPLEYYVLMQTISALRRRERLDEAVHPDLFRVDIPAGKYQILDPDTGDLSPGPATYVIIPEGWANWPLHLRYGQTPARATQYVLTGGEPAPISTAYHGDEKIEYTD